MKKLARSKACTEKKVSGVKTDFPESFMYFLAVKGHLEVSRVLLIADSEKKCSKHRYLVKNRYNFQKTGNFRRIEFLPEVILVPKNKSSSPSLVVWRVMAPF